MTQNRGTEIQIEGAIAAVIWATPRSRSIGGYPSQLSAGSDWAMDFHGQITGSDRKTVAQLSFNSAKLR